MDVIVLIFALFVTESTGASSYDYLDNTIYSVSPPQNDSDPDQGRIFPHPPHFPPPPPALAGDTNSLLKLAIFNNIEANLKDEAFFESGSRQKSNGAEEMCPQFLKSTEDVEETKERDEPVGPPGKVPSAVQQGPPGKPGSIGPVGPKGDRGRRGRKGPVGPPGDQGPQGVPGPVGAEGPRGPTGLPGQVGPKGDTGSEGSKGPKGHRGHRGQKGSHGRRGADGIPGVTQCGDGILDRDQGEQCDDGNEDYHDSCIACRVARCGDGILYRGNEECDGRDFGGKSCASWREGMIGRLTCTSSCRISYQRCRFGDG